jgi:hypothetical protein
MFSRLTIFATLCDHGEAAIASMLETGKDAGGGHLSSGLLSSGSSSVGSGGGKRPSLPDLLRRKSISAASMIEGARPGEIAFEFLVVYGCGGEWYPTHLQPYL